MYIDSLKGTVEYQKFEEYKEIISAMILSGAENEIHIYTAECDDNMDEEDPATLSILVKDGQTVVNYFSVGNETLFASVGDMEKDGNLEWKIGSETYSATQYQLISLGKLWNVPCSFLLRRKSQIALNGKNYKFRNR